MTNYKNDRRFNGSYFLEEVEWKLKKRLDEIR